MGTARSNPTGMDRIAANVGEESRIAGMKSAAWLIIRVIAIAMIVVQVRADGAGRPFGDNVRARGSLDNCRLKFERERKGNVAFIGGSITEMEGYRPMACELLKKRFAQTE